MAELESLFKVPVIESYGMTEAAHQMGATRCLPVSTSPARSVSRQAQKSRSWTPLAQRLTGFKIPSQVVIVPAIPKGPTGKLQRIGLADKRADHLKQQHAVPRNEFERILADIFTEVLKIESFGIDDNFFALGGDSLRATRVTRIAVIFDIDLPNVVVFRSPTIAELAGEIAESMKTIDPISAEILAGPHSAEELEKILEDNRNG